MALLLSNLIIAAVVLWSAVVAFKSIAPKSAYRLNNHLAQWCAARGWRRLANSLKSASPKGCGGGCGCETNPAKNTEPTVQAVKWK